MTTLIVPPLEKKPWPTLGAQVCDFVEERLVFGPGDLRGKQAHLDDEKRALVYRMYEVYPRDHENAGRRRFKRVALSLRKGVAKTEFAAWIAAVELHPEGPVRCDGWRRVGSRWEPVGVGVADPYIPMVAYTEEQTEDLAYYALLTILAEGSLADDFDIGLERIMRIRGDGKAVALAGAPNARDGARTTFQHFDEEVSLDTPLPTPTGWTTMGEVHPGDELIGRDGRPCRVMGKSPVHFDRPTYRVTFSDGTSVVADAQHLWYAHRRGGCGHGRGCRCTVRQGWAVRCTADMLDTLCDGGSRRAFTYHVPIAAPFKIDEADLPIDPYMLGLWLGDGDRASGGIAVGAEDIADVAALVQACGYEVGTYKRVRLPVRGLTGLLRGLGVLNEKHVPEVYLRASRDQRLSLVQGLMDSDGHATKGGWCTFVNTNPDLVAGIVELLRTVGHAPTVIWREDARKQSYLPVAKVSFQGDQQTPVFQLPRKLARLPERRLARHDRRAIVSIEPVESVPMQCLAVDSDDHLFLAGEGMVPTHNTHRFTLPRLIAAHQTMQANLPKRKMADAWSLETTTAYVPGEDSVAEKTMGYAKSVADGKARESSLFFFHRQASDEHDLSTEAGARAAVIEASGPTVEWSDIDGIVGLWADPTTDRNYWERVWTNRPTGSVTAWLPYGAWERLGAKRPVREKTEITLGFYGAYDRSSTALVGCTVEPPHVFLLGSWEQPAHERKWRVPVRDVLSAVEDAMETYAVKEFAPSPIGWRAEVESWEDAYGETCVRFETNRTSMWGPVCDEFYQAVNDSSLSHDGSEVVSTHMGQASPVTRSGYSVLKSPVPACAGAAVIAYSRAHWYATAPPPQGSAYADHELLVV